MNFTILANNNLDSQENIIDQVEYLYKLDAETLNHSKVIELSQKIIDQRINYPSEIVAKTYLLLASIANNKGELETALQFTNDGLAITTQNKITRLRLVLSLAKIFSEKKQYQNLLTTIQQAIKTLQNKKNTTWFLIALSYRSIAFSMLGEQAKALEDLHRVQFAIQQSSTFSEHIFLLNILASAYYHLGDFQAALTLQLKILKLRFHEKNLNNIEQTYFHLANTYYRLNRFDDAYTAFGESKNYAINKNAPIYIAFASQGLSLTLLSQKQYSAAKTEALHAKGLFYKNNISNSYLESIIILIKIYRKTEQVNQYLNLLLEAEKLVKQSKLSADYIILYKYLAEMHFHQRSLNKAYSWQNKYSAALLANLLHNQNTTEPNNLSINSEFQKSITNKSIPANIKNQELASSFSDKFRKQQLFIIISTAITSVLLLYVVFLWINQRKKRQQIECETLDKLPKILTNSVQTKESYQVNFNMARKCNYPLTLGYISITNWQELTFQFNKKTVEEVRRCITHLINGQLNEFDTAGLINDGEYLLCYPHQNNEDVTQTIENLISTLKLRFFANLGEFTIIIAYSIKSPDFRDTDPYVFLSQLSDSIKLA